MNLVSLFPRCRMHSSFLVSAPDAWKAGSSAHTSPDNSDSDLETIDPNVVFPPTSGGNSSPATIAGEHALGDAGRPVTCGGASRHAVGEASHGESIGVAGRFSTRGSTTRRAASTVTGTATVTSSESEIFHDAAVQASTSACRRIHMCVTLPYGLAKYLVPGCRCLRSIIDS